MSAVNEDLQGDAGPGGPPGLGPLEALLVLLLLPLAALAWAALITAHAGQLSSGLVLGCAGATLFAALLLLRRWRVATPSSRANMSFAGSGTDRWAELAAIALIGILVARLLPLGTPWPAYLDASFYLNTAARIVEEGGLSFTAPALDAPLSQARQFVATFSDQRDLGLPFPDSEGLGFYDVLYAAEIGEGGVSGSTAQAFVTPYHPPIFASYLAFWGRVSGLNRMPLGLLPWAFAYLLAVSAIALRAYGRGAAILAVAIVGLGPSFAYHGGNPYAELMAGALLLGGVWGLMLLERAESSSPILAAGVGCMLGLSALTKIDVWPAVALVLVAMATLRRDRGDMRERLALLLGFGLPIVHLLLLALGPSRLYLSLNLGGVAALVLARAPELVMLVIGVGLASVGWRARGGQFSSLPARMAGRPARVALGLLLVLLLAAITLRDGFRAEDALPSMFAISAWAMTPLGLWAAMAGLVMALESGAARLRPLVWLGLTALPLVLVAPVVTRSLSSLYTLRRLAPLALPLMAIFAAGAAVQLSVRPRPTDTGAAMAEALAAGHASSAWTWFGRHRREEVLRVLAAGFAALLVLVGTFQAASPFVGANGRDFSGGQALIERISAYAEADDTLVFASAIGGNQAGRLAAPMRSLTSLTALQLGPRVPDADALGEWVSERLEAGERILMVVDAEQELPSISGFDYVSLGEEALVTRAPAPNPHLPPVFSPLSFDLRVFVLEKAVETTN